MILQCIGTVVSPYTKRMGTPRQGSLVPSSRAFVDLTIPTEALDGIETYSHVWIVFGFHANTNTSQNNCNKTPKTKVRPPRANQKVGQLATRSPHRPNPLGLSLVQVEKLDTRLKRLHVSGIDLVNGTPVYDIKPCVPWDIPGHTGAASTASSTTNMIVSSDVFRVPDWVDQKDAIATVKFTEEALASLLRMMVDEDRLAPLYTAKNGGFEAAHATLVEILAQDPRSSHKGLKHNQRGTTKSAIKKAAAAAAAANANDECKNYSLVFVKTQVEFQVLSWGVQVVRVTAVDFDEDAYVEGIPLNGI